MTGLGQGGAEVSYVCETVVSKEGDDRGGDASVAASERGASPDRTLCDHLPGGRIRAVSMLNNRCISFPNFLMIPAQSLPSTHG